MTPLGASWPKGGGVEAIAKRGGLTMATTDPRSMAGTIWHYCVYCGHKAPTRAVLAEHACAYTTNAAWGNVPTYVVPGTAAPAAPAAPAYSTAAYESARAYAAQLHIWGAREAKLKTALERLLRFTAGLQLGDQSLAVQRERAALVHDAIALVNPQCAVADSMSDARRDMSRPVKGGFRQG
jgi:hypothetical protein